MGRLRRSKLKSFFAFLTIFSCGVSAAYADSHTFACVDTPQSFTICRGDATICPVNSAISRTSPNDVYKIQGAPPGTVVTIQAVYRELTLPAVVSFVGQGQTQTPLNVIHTYTSLGEAFSVSTTSTSTQNIVQVKVQIENNDQPPPQILDTTVTCTPAQATGSITIIKTAIGGNGTFSFSGTLGNFQITTVNGSGTQSFGSLQPGTYTVTETVPGGWAFTRLSCSSSSTISATTATITLGAGQNITCTYTNTAQAPQTGTITIVKSAIGGNSTFSFSGTLGSFQITTVNGTGSQSFPNLQPGTYTVTETVPGGWTFTTLSCSGSSTVSGTTATITLVAGQNITCTYTNTFQGTTTGSITIVKTATGGNGTFSFAGTLGNFQITTANGSGSQSFNNLQAGTYTVSETVPAGWTLTSLTCSDRSTIISGSTATITLGAAQSVTCTFANTAQVPGAGSITIVKSTNGTGDSTFGFTGTGSLGVFAITTAGGTGSLTFPNLSAGTYRVAEIVPAGWALVSLACSGSATISGATANIALAAGQDVTCTFTNTAVVTPGTGTITIVKSANGGDGTFAFSASGPLGANFTITTSGGSGSRTFSNILSRTYTITENDTAGFKFASISCSGDTNGNTSVDGRTGTIGLDAGETITCTYVNTAIPAPGTGTITIVKVAQGGDATFTF